MADMYIGYTNLITTGSTLSSIDKTSEATTYETTNLEENHLYPPWRSAGKALNLNGSTNYAYVADHADFDATSALTIEYSYNQIPVGGAEDVILDKLDANDGYSLRITDVGKVKLTLYNAATTDAVCETNAAVHSAATWERVKVSYDGSGTPSVKFYVDGTLVASTTTSGTIPAALGTQAVRVTVGATSAGGQALVGTLGWVGVALAVEQDGTYLDPSTCGGYWDFNDSDLTDSSGNSHTLTGAALDSSNYIDFSALEWLEFTFAATQNPTKLIIIGHNLTSSASIRLGRNGIYDAWDVVDTLSVTAGEPIIADVSSTTETQWWLEIQDSGNSYSYVELGYVYLGAVTDLTVSAQDKTLQILPTTQVIQNRTALGNPVTYQLSEQKTGYEFNLFHFVGNMQSSGDDFTTLFAALQFAQLGNALIWCVDGPSDAGREVAYTDLFYWVNAANINIHQELMKLSDATDDEENTMVVSLRPAMGES